jgi:LPPG:FO 2-phospho-L-lactate transferase
MITALGGGVGAAKFLKGLSQILRNESLTVVVNTGDDIQISGLKISPDIDTIIYWLSGIADRERGWGIGRDSFHCLKALGRFGIETWFNIGDGDLATHIYRTHLRSVGLPPSEIASIIARAFQINNIKILPMTDDDVETWILTDEGEMHFQEYLIKMRMNPRVKGISIKGIEGSRGIIVCPSNPIISIGPILAVQGVREALQRAKTKVVAISPLVGGAPLKGPADRLMKGLGLEVSSTQVAKLYGDFLDEIVIDEKDSYEVDSIRSMGIKPTVTDIIMSDDEKSRRLGETVLELFDGAR